MSGNLLPDGGASLLPSDASLSCLFERLTALQPRHEMVAVGLLVCGSRWAAAGMDEVLPADFSDPLLRSVWEALSAFRVWWRETQYGSDITDDEMTDALDRAGLLGIGPSEIPSVYFLALMRGATIAFDEWVAWGDFLPDQNPLGRFARETGDRVRIAAAERLDDAIATSRQSLGRSDDWRDILAEWLAQEGAVNAITH